MQETPKPKGKKLSIFNYQFSIKALPCRNGGMVDTRDLKSLGHCARAGSRPASGTKNQTQSFVNKQFTRDFLFLCTYCHI